jgi:hypothetical protein
MIDNEFILETSLKFDIPYLLNLVTCSIKHKDIKRHQRLVNDDPYLSYINSQIPELAARWNFYNLAPYANIPAHVDALRNCALNIPLQGTVDSKTLFYKPVNSENLVYDDEKVLHWAKTDLEKAYEFSLLTPTLIKNDIPHSVTNGPHRRIILSWSINIDISFEQARLLFKDRAIDFSQHSC